MELKRELARHLSDVIIPFWTGLRDQTRGGFVGYVGFNLKPNPYAPRGCIHNSRILWFFSEAYTLLQHPKLLDCARQAYHYLDHFVDRREGGLYWLCDANGRPADVTKHTYNHAFAVYALAAYARASASEEALKQALLLFDLIEARMTADGSYLDAFSRGFKPLRNDKLSDNPTLMARGMAAERTMNTMLHVMEAYTLLYTAGGGPRVRDSLIWLLTQIRDKVYNPEKNRMEVFFDGGMRTLIDMQSYGHDIEASWLWDLAADAVLEGAERARVKEITARLARGVLERAFRDGSLLNECVEGDDDPMRIWWVQAEAMVGMANLWRKTGDPALMENMRTLWRYIRDVIVDPRPGGEWFAEINPRGRPVQLPVADPWKAPYHNGRMCMEMMKRL